LLASAVFHRGIFPLLLVAPRETFIASLVAVAVLLLAVWWNRFDSVLSELVVKNFAAIIDLFPSLLRLL